MFITVEIQQTGEQVANLVTSYKNQNEAEAHFHTVMAAAALSKVPVHSCIVIDERCNIFQAGFYEHPAGEV